MNKLPRLVAWLDVLSGIPMVETLADRLLYAEGLIILLDLKTDVFIALGMLSPARGPGLRTPTT